MKHIILQIIILFTCACIMHAQVIDYEIDPSFDTGDYFQRGSVTAINFYEEEIIITGDFSSVPNTANWWTNLDYTGNLISGYPWASSGPNGVKPYGENFIAFIPQIGITNYQADGDGDDFDFEYQKDAYFAGWIVTDQVGDVMVYQDSLILVAGVYFTDSLDLTANSIRQLCLIDSTGAPVPDFPMVKCEPFNAMIHTIDTLSTGEYIIAGRFTHVNGHPTNNIAKLNADFSVDTEFGQSMTAGGEAFVRLIDSEDRIWVIAGFTSLIDLPGSDSPLFRLLPSGELDLNFNPPTTQRINEDDLLINTFPNNVFEDEDGFHIVLGPFEFYNGTPVKGFIKIADDGSLITDFFNHEGIDEAEWGPYSNYPTLGQIEKLPDGKILLGGRFSSFGGEPYSCLVRLQPSGFVGLDKKAGRGKLKVYPNPAHANIRIEVPDQNTQIKQIAIYDLSGRQVLSHSIENLQMDIDVSGLANGIYEVRASANEMVFTQKLVVQR